VNQVGLFTNTVAVNFSLPGALTCYWYIF